MAETSGPHQAQQRLPATLPARWGHWKQEAIEDFLRESGRSLQGHHHGALPIAWGDPPRQPRSWPSETKVPSRTGDRPTWVELARSCADRLQKLGGFTATNRRDGLCRSGATWAPTLADFPYGPGPDC